MSYLQQLQRNYLIKQLIITTYSISQIWHKNARNIFYCTESISFLGPKIRCTVPVEFEELTSLRLFRKAIKNVNLKIILPDYARHGSRKLSFSIIYYFLRFVFIWSLMVLPHWLLVQLLIYLYFLFLHAKQIYA